MNLVANPWIPVIDHGGDKKLVGLEELFREGEQLRDLAVNPVHRIALMRLLICITQAALDGPEDELDWFHCAPRIADSAIDYLNKWHDRFELYGDRPFLQARELKSLGNASLDKLDFGLSAGNNSTLFDHEASPGGRSQTDAWCARHLLAFLCFSPGGLIGKSEWDGAATSGTSEHSPAVEGSMLHSLLLGETLTTTIWLNLLTKRRVAELPNMNFGRPVWEFEAIPDALRRGGISESYLGRLVPLPRAIRLNEGSTSFTLANGVSYPKLPSQRDTMATVVRRGKGNKEKDAYIAVDLQRHPWRELVSVATVSQVGMAGGAVALGHLQQLDKKNTVTLWTGGLAADRAKILDVAEWTFTLAVSWLDERPIQHYGIGVELAGQGGNFLREAVKDYYSNFQMDAKLIPHDVSQTHYWSALDNRYETLIEAASAGAPLDESWYPVVLEAMEAAYAHACPHTTARQIQAFAKGKAKLKLKKLNDRPS